MQASHEWMIAFCLQFKLDLWLYDDNLFFCLQVEQHRFTLKLLTKDA